MNDIDGIFDGKTLVFSGTSGKTDIGDIILPSMKKHMNNLYLPIISLQ